MTEPVTAPLIVFVHVPKTAGTSFNTVLRRWQRAGVAHCEAIIGAPEVLRTTVSGCHWISGHVSRSRMHTCLSQATDRKLRFFTLLRDPTAQIASHYNWIIEIFHKGHDFFMTHPEPIRNISDHIRRSDNSRPEVILENIARYGRLFLNAQSGLALGAAQKPEPEALSGVFDSYEDVATEHGFGALARRATGQPCPVSIRENESGYHFDRSVFASDPVQAFLREHHAHDIALYAAARTRELARPAHLARTFAGV